MVIFSSALWIACENICKSDYILCVFCAGAIRRDLWKRCSGREQKITRKLQEVVAGGSDLAHGCRGRITHCTETPVRIRKTEDPNTPTASFRHPATMKELQKYLFWIYLFPFYCQEIPCLHPTSHCVLLTEWSASVMLCHMTQTAWGCFGFS